MAPTPYEKASQLIDEAHAQDPNKITLSNGSTSIPYELHYAQKMTKYLKQRDPTASEVLQLAVRAQHFRRWEVPRSSYPQNRAGYLTWRTALKNRQAAQVQEICLESGYSAEDARRIASLIRKEDLMKGEDEEVQVLEDVACLVFLDDQFEEFERGQEEEKILAILKKTWAKMSEKGRELVGTIEMSERARGLIAKALES